MYLLSRVTWYSNGRTEISPENVAADLDIVRNWLAYNFPDAGPVTYDNGSDLWRTTPQNVYGSQVLWSISRIEELRG